MKQPKKIKLSLMIPLLINLTSYPVSHQLSFSISKETITNLLCLSLGTAGIYLTTKGLDTDDTTGKQRQHYKTFSGIGMVVVSLMILYAPSKDVLLWKKG